ncbi:MAG TPA: DUF5989 family protein [Planctomycetota bacterium]|nr:DUF5989 family protein [Planctomycetota bacterium]
MTQPDQDKNAFAAQATQAAPSFAAEFWDYLKNNKKWWLTPILIVLALMGVVLILAASGAAPFIYTLF